MRYQIVPLYCRPWTLNGISPQLIESHYQNNYGGALRDLNSIAEELDALDPAATAPHAIGRLKHEEMAALNSVLLHELYFAGLGGDGRAVPEAMAAAIARDFGSVDRWRAEFAALAEALSASAGWVLLTWLPRDARLINQSVTDTSPAVAGAIPILALDMYEHAYHLDFGANSGAYVAAFLRNIDWDAVQARYEDAVAVKPLRPLEQPQFTGLPSVSAEAVNAMLRAGEAVQIIDARPKHYVSRTHEIMDGAVWRDPERVDEWIGRALAGHAGGHLLRLRLPRRVRNGGKAARGRGRRALHDGRTRCMEGDQGAGEALRAIDPRASVSFRVGDRRADEAVRRLAQARDDELHRQRAEDQAQHPHHDGHADLAQHPADRPGQHEGGHDGRRPSRRWRPGPTAMPGAPSLAASPAWMITVEMAPGPISSGMAKGTISRSKRRRA